jgi:hypothetical protein
MLSERDTVMTSPDGITWTAQSEISGDQWWEAVVYASGIFVSVGYSEDDYSGMVMTSTDGITWTEREGISSSEEWASIAYGAGRFVVGNYGGYVMTSVDGIAWVYPGPEEEQGSWTDIAYGNGVYVAVDAGQDMVLVSTNGLNWTLRNAPGQWWEAITFGNGTFVAVGRDFLSGRVMTSPDGITWTEQTGPGVEKFPEDVIYAGGQFVLVGYDWDGTGGIVMTSPDGITWTEQTDISGDQHWYAIAYGGGIYVAVGSDSTIMTSPDGITWTAQTDITGNPDWYAVTYGNNAFVAVGSNDTIMTSPDGITWTAQTEIAGYQDWNAITYGNGIFIAVGFSDALMTSTDGVNWVMQYDAPDYQDWKSVIYANGKFVVGGNGVIMSSPLSAMERALTVGGLSVFNGAQSVLGSALFKSPFNSTTAFQIQNAAGNSLFTVDTTNSRIQIGTSDTTATLLVLDTKTDSSDPTGVNGAMYYNSNAGKFRCYQAGAWTDCLSAGVGATKKITLTPEFVGSTIMGDGSNNAGTMTTDFCSGSANLNINVGICNTSTDEQNFYAWTTDQGTAQDYDIYLRYQMPTDFDGFSSSTTLKMHGWRSTVNDLVELAVFKNGTQCGTTTNVATANTTWTQTTIAGDETACGIVANDVIVLRIRLTATNGNYARAGAIEFEYTAKY